MNFKDFMLNEKVSDLPKDLQDTYWKIIHNFNSWKKSRDPKKQSSLQTQMSQFKDVLKRYGVLDQKSMDAWDEKMNMVFGKSDVPDIKKRNPKPNISSDKPEPTVKEPEQNDEDFNKIEIDQDFVEKAFDKFNQKYFNGVLEPIPLKIDTSNSSSGAFWSSTDFNNKKIVPIYIQLNPNECNVSFSYFRNTLVHEMLHYYVLCYMPLDPNPEISDNLWEEAIYNAKMYRIYGTSKYQIKCSQILELSNTYSHSKRWLKIAKQLNTKYPELTITRNTFGSLPDNTLDTVNKLKNASLYKITTEFSYIPGIISSFEKYKILLNDFDSIYDNFIKESPITSDKFLKLCDNFKCTDLFGASFDKIIKISIEKAPIVKPQANVNFNLNDFTPKQSFIDAKYNWFKQMKQSKIFGSFKNIGTIIMNKNNTNNESFDSFSTWVDKNNFITEKSISKSKKFTIQELEELGFTENDIEALENGEFDFDTSTI